MSKRFRIEIDIEAPDSVPEVMVRLWVNRLLLDTRGKRVLKVTVTQTHPEQTL